MTRDRLSARARRLGPSPTLAITARARELARKGVDVLNLAAGEPDFGTPEPVVESAIRALREGKTKYTPSSGIAELKQAIVEKLQRENDFPAKPEQIVVSCGAKHSVFNALMCVVGPGDEVVVPAPYWMTYAEQIELAGGVMVPVASEPSSGFLPDLERIQAAITPRTRAVIFNSPCNPTGAVFPRGFLVGLAELALHRGLVLIADEIYERLVYGEPHVSIASLSPEVAEQTVTIGGCSKSYAMTGWRIGFACAPPALATAMSNLQDQVTSNPTTFAQYGAVEALQLPNRVVEDMRSQFERRRDLIVEGLRSIPGVRIVEPRGAFYAFADFSAHLGEQWPDDEALAAALLDEVHVATIPGSVFEGPGFLRASYAASPETIQKAMDRIKSFLS